MWIDGFAYFDEKKSLRRLNFVAEMRLLIDNPT